MLLKIFIAWVRGIRLLIIWIEFGRYFTGKVIPDKTVNRINKVFWVIKVSLVNIITDESKIDIEKLTTDKRKILNTITGIDANSNGIPKNKLKTNITENSIKDLPICSR